jgi:hypothetical protein
LRRSACLSMLGWVRLRGHVATSFPPFARLGRFRAEPHACCTRRADALVELGDALLCAPAFGSLVFAVDVTTWPRGDAECSPQPRLLPSPLAALGRAADHRRLGLPVDRRLGPRPRRLDRPGGRHPAAPGRRHRPDRRRAGPCAAWPAAAGGAVPLFVLDAGYDSAQLTLDPAEQRVAVLGRLRADRCLDATPATGQDGPATPPRRHVGLRRPGHLARPDRHPCHRR